MSQAGPAIRQSVLERLVDTAPGVATDVPQRWNDGVAQKRASVQRDLEWLLNTRRIAEPASAEFPEVRASLYHFGLPDISSRSADSADSRRQLLLQIEETVRTFEPRLTSVQVSLRGGAEDGPHRVRFVIEAMMRMEPDPERVVFDTVLEVTSGEFVVAGGDDA
jgi:type VI secretion system protein ImpF